MINDFDEMAIKALGDNMEFFFKSNTGLEPDTWPYKEQSL